MINAEYRASSDKAIAFPSEVKENFFRREILRNCIFSSSSEDFLEWLSLLPVKIPGIWDRDLGYCTRQLLLLVRI
jgi:hypothetical protein